MATILTCRFENCFGITKMDHTFCFDGNKNVFTIYAKNGLMKTSFTEIFSKVREGKTDNIKDRIFDKKPKWHLCKDESCQGVNCKNLWNLNKDSLYVIKMDNNYQSENLANLLVHDEIKKKLNKLFELKKGFLNSLAEKSGLKYSDKDTSLEKELRKDLDLETDGFLFNLENLEKIQNKLKNQKFNFNDIKYTEIIINDIIEKDKFQKYINEFKAANDKIFEKYDFFKKGEFGFAELQIIAKELKSNNFFVNDNEIRLNNNPAIKNKNDLDKKIQEIEKKVKESSALNEIYKLISSKDKRNWKRIIENKVWIVDFLQKDKINLLKEELWISYIKENEQKFNELKDGFKKFEEEIKDYKGKRTEWKEALKIFKKRFYVPFEMVISNKDIAISGLELPEVVFKFVNKNNKNETKHRERGDGFEDTLSQGERRALYLLNVIFDIEELKIKNPNGDKFIIVDDIADSFDYKNKYAILEYLAEISEKSGFYLIILTHNFDFYRAVNLRLSPHIKGKLFATKQNNQIKLENLPLNIDDKIFFLDWMKDFNEQNFIALIPYVRNIIEFTNNKDHKPISGTKNDYGILSNVLHTKKISKNQTIKYDDIAKIFKKHIKIDIDDKVIQKLDNDKYDIWDKIYLEADKIVSNKFSSFNLEEELKLKIILSIAARLKSEEYMIKKLNPSNKQLKENKNLPKLLKLCVDKGVIKENDEDWFILKQVSVITPENIHINSFMFEPLIDIDFNDLKDWYEDVKDKLK